MSREAGRSTSLRGRSWRITRNWGLTAEGLIEGAHAADRARHSRAQPRSCPACRRGATSPSRTRQRARRHPMLTELLAFLDQLLSSLEHVRAGRGEGGRSTKKPPRVEGLTQKTRALRDAVSAEPQKH